MATVQFLPHIVCSASTLATAVSKPRRTPVLLSLTLIATSPLQPLFSLPFPRKNQQLSPWLHLFLLNAPLCTTTQIPPPTLQRCCLEHSPRGTSFPRLATPSSSHHAFFRQRPTGCSGSTITAVPGLVALSHTKVWLSSILTPSSRVCHSRPPSCNRTSLQATVRRRPALTLDNSVDASPPTCSTGCSQSPFPRC